jgi:hypothetical protein
MIAQKFVFTAPNMQINMNKSNSVHFKVERFLAIHCVFPYKKAANAYDVQVIIQWSLVNPDAINPDASNSRRFFGGTKYMKIYHMRFTYPNASFIWTIFLGTKVSGLTRLHCMYTTPDKSHAWMHTALKVPPTQETTITQCTI